MRTTLRSSSLATLLLAVAVTAAADDGPTIYKQLCASCHDTGARSRADARRAPGDDAGARADGDGERARCCRWPAAAPASSAARSPSSSTGKPFSAAFSTKPSPQAMCRAVSDEFASPLSGAALERLGREHAEHPISGWPDGRPRRRRRAEAQAEVGIRLPWRAERRRTAVDRRWPRVRRNAERHGLRAERRHRMRPLDVQRRRRGPRRDHDRAARVRESLRGIRRRSRRERLRARRDHRNADLEEPRRRPSVCPRHRLADVSQRPSLCRRRLRRRDRRRGRRLPVLHLPGQSRGPRRRERRAASGRRTRSRSRRSRAKNRIGTQMWGPSGAPIWSSPAIDVQKNAVYVTTGNNYSGPATDRSDAFVAFDHDLGHGFCGRAR